MYICMYPLSSSSPLPLLKVSPTFLVSFPLYADTQFKLNLFPELELEEGESDSSEDTATGGGER